MSENSHSYNIANVDVEEIQKHLEEGFSLENINKIISNAYYQGNKTIVNLLIDYGADKETCLIWAVLRCNLDWIQYVVSLGAEPSRLTNAVINYLIIYLDTSKDIPILQYLIDLGMPIKWTCLKTIIEKGNLYLFKLFLDRIADIDLSKVWEILCCYYCYSSVEIIHYLLDLPIDFDMSKSGEKLIPNVIELYQTDIFKKILNRVSDPRLIINIKHLTLACKIKNYEVVKIILELGINSNVPGDDKKCIDTPLSMALYEHINDGIFLDIKIIKLLLDYGATINDRCLTMAVDSKDWEIFDLIYQTCQWSIGQLCNALESAVFINSIEKIWKFLHKQIGDDLDDENLNSILFFSLVNENYDVFEYFIHFYDKHFILERIINANIIGQLFEEEDDYTIHSIEYLIKVYGAETIFSLIPHDKKILFQINKDDKN